jgi:hypothetical protein
LSNFHNDLDVIAGRDFDTPASVAAAVAALVAATAVLEAALIVKDILTTLAAANSDTCVVQQETKLLRDHSREMFQLQV